jgi:hypothetical protein
MKCPTVMHLGPIVVLAAGLAVVGCRTIAESIATDMAAPRLSTLTLRIGGSAAAYLDCIKSHQGGCGKDAANALPPKTILAGALVAKMRKSETRSGIKEAFDVEQKLGELYDELTGRSETSRSKIPLVFTSEELEAFYKYVEEQTLGDGWRADAQRAAAEASQTTGDDSSAVVNKRLACFLRLEEEYCRSYFRDGRFMQVKLERDNVKAELKKRFPALKEDEIAKILDSLDADFSKSVFGSVATTGFVARGGQTFQFPVLTIGLDPLGKEAVAPPKVDAMAVGADLVRLTVEALFDSLSRLPAVNAATGCLKDKSEDASRDVPQDCALPVFDPGKGPVTEEQFGQVNTIANQAEGAASSVVGRLVRGAGPIALNNEAVGRLVETLIGVTVRKAVEKGAWCWYACQLSGAPPSVPDGKARPQELTIEITVKGTAAWTHKKAN